MRNGEDHVHILHWQQFLTAFREPVIPSVGLTLWTMSGAARVEGDGLIAALATTIPVPTERGGAAMLDGKEHAQLQPRQPGSIPFDKAVAIFTNDVGHLKGVAVSFFVQLPGPFYLVRA